MIGYSRYEPHRSVFGALDAESLLFCARPEAALARAGEARARRRAGEPFVLWEHAPDAVLDAWGAPDLVLSNGFLPHYGTVSWDRRGWVASAAWPKRRLEPLDALARTELLLWIRDYRRRLQGPHPLRATDLGADRPYVLVVLQNEDDLVARWWHEGRGSEWLVRHAVERARGRQVIAKQHPYDPKAPEEYDVDPTRVRFLTKDAVRRQDLARVNDALLAGADEVWGFNSTLLTEAALLHGVAVRAFGPTLLDGHGILREETPALGAAEAAPALPPEARPLALLRRVLARQLDPAELGAAAADVLADRDVAPSRFTAGRR